MGNTRNVVAVVDDDSRVLESLEDLLESEGYSPRLFGSATEFLESGTLPSIGCLISDIRMPAMDGWELQRVAKRERPDLAVILITGHDDSERHRRVRAGERPVMFRKPFDGRELMAAVRSAIASTGSPGFCA
jgi:FixJ family two-component response regulator